MIEEKKLPPELWSIVRDLWTLRLSKLAVILEEPDVPPNGGGGPKSAHAAEVPSDGEQPALKWPKSWMTPKRTLDAFPKLLDTVGLCYLGIILLRLDVSLGDIHRWIHHGDIVYHRAIRSIPADMIEKMPGEHQEALDTMTLLGSDDLHATVARLMICYSKEFEMTYPALNMPLLLSKYIAQLALPSKYSVHRDRPRSDTRLLVELFPAFQNLNNTITKFRFSYPNEWIKRQNLLGRYPELQIMSLLVVAVKLYWPFDNILRYPESAAEPAAQRMDWEKWIQIHNGRDPTSTGMDKNEFEITEDDIFRMTGEEIDSYMDWHQRQWLPTTEQTLEGAPKDILDLFPLKDLGPAPPHQDSESKFQEEVTRKLRTAQSQLLFIAPVSKDEEAARQDSENVPRPGSEYKNWRTEEDLPETAKAFLKIAANAIAVSPRFLLSGVAHTERIIEKWKVERRRREQFPEEYSEDEDAEEVEEEEEDEGEGEENDVRETTHDISRLGLRTGGSETVEAE
ncbi:MAG: hypothetical protein Q9227_001605 [Pyrenula ochraceoflavens]